MADPYVLDSYAYLAYVQDEPGADVVEGLLERAARGDVNVHMTVVNVAEVLYWVWRREGEEEAREVVGRMGALGLAIDDVDLVLARAAGGLKAQYTVSLADCFAAARAQQLHASVVTGDPEFKALENVVDVEWI